MRSHWHRNVLHKGDPQTPQGIHFTGLEAMLSTDRMWRSRLFGGTRTLPSLPERDFLGVSLVIRGFRDSDGLDGLDIPQGCLRSLSGNAVFCPQPGSVAQWPVRRGPLWR